MSKKQKPTGNTGRKNQIKGKYAEKKWFRKILSDFAGYYECGIYGSTRTA